MKSNTSYKVPPTHPHFILSHVRHSPLFLFFSRRKIVHGEIILDEKCHSFVKYIFQSSSNTSKTRQIWRLSCFTNRQWLVGVANIARLMTANALRGGSTPFVLWKGILIFGEKIQYSTYSAICQSTYTNHTFVFIEQKKNEMKIMFKKYIYHFPVISGRKKIINKVGGGSAGERTERGRDLGRDDKTEYGRVNRLHVSKFKIKE